MMALSKHGLTHCRWVRCGLVLTLLFQACATVPEKKLVENGLTIKYLPISATDIEKIQLQHPAQISENLIRLHLESLWYEGLTSLGKRGRVFSDADVNKSSRLIAKALNQAKPNNIVRFELATATGPTDAEVFVESDHLHWRFQLIKGEMFTCNISNANCLGVNWRLILKGSQRYFSMQKLLGMKNMENWIVADIDPASPKPNKEDKATKDASKTLQQSGKNETAGTNNSKTQGLEERLRYLKHLYDKGLISEEEYRRNQQKAMDEKF